MRIGLAVLMMVHGIAHLVGFTVPWKLTESIGQPYRTTILFGVLDLGEAGIRLYGLVWLVLGLAFLLVSVGLLLRAPWWYRGALVTAALSTVFCLVSLPEARVGVAVNLFVVATILASGRLLAPSVRFLF